MVQIHLFSTFATSLLVVTLTRSLLQVTGYEFSEP